jgi:NAD-dependent DNA ligase
MVLDDQMAEVKVLDVIWEASKDGYLKPVVQVEPIRLGGVTIKQATGFNAGFIETNRIGMGAVIQIIRSGDVIPHIRGVVVPADRASMPTVPYVWNATHVDIMLEDPMDDATVREKNITGFFRGLEVEGLSAGNVARIVAAGFDSVAKILAMGPADFISVEGFKEKMAMKLFNGIGEKVEGASLVKVAAASNVFGRGFSDKKLGAIFEEYPDILTSVEDKGMKVARLAGSKGMAAKTAEAFVVRIPAFMGFLEECKLLGKLGGSSVVGASVGVTVTSTGGPLYKRSIVMSGSRDKELEKFIADSGGNLGSAVSRNTFAVITPEPDSGTGKVAKAKELGVAIYTPDQFRRKYM